MFLYFHSTVGPAGGGHVHWPPPIEMTQEEEVCVCGTLLHALCHFAAAAHVIVLETQRLDDCTLLLFRPLPPPSSFSSFILLLFLPPPPPPPPPPLPQQQQHHYVNAPLVVLRLFGARTFWTAFQAWMWPRCRRPFAAASRTKSSATLPWLDNRNKRKRHM